jgi:hypothetical protein
LLPNGKVCLIPCNSAYVGIYDPVANTYANGPAHGQSGTGLFYSGVQLPDGRVVLIPYSLPQIGIYHSGGTATLAACLSPYFNKL